MEKRHAATHDDPAGRARNPFGVMDVPTPQDAEVMAFAAATTLPGGDDDVNAQPWNDDGHTEMLDRAGIDGPWASRWNGGQDPTITGDSPTAWKVGAAEACAAGDRVHFRFEWDEGRRRGLIEAQRDGARLIGKYVNLSDPRITRPWIGLIVSDRRIDGRWPGGRLDFRR
jgi:hypothetical protein